MVNLLDSCSIPTSLIRSSKRILKKLELETRLSISLNRDLINNKVICRRILIKSKKLRCSKMKIFFRNMKKFNFWNNKVNYKIKKMIFYAKLWLSWEKRLLCLKGTKILETWIKRLMIMLRGTKSKSVDFWPMLWARIAGNKSMNP